MLFKETLDRLTPDIREAVKELFNAAAVNQSHENDMLLIIEHGFYNDLHLEYFKKNKLSPYCIGPNEEGFAEHTQYEFYHSFRQNICTDRKKFIEMSVKNEDEVYEIEKNSIHLEMIVYLKFWEADMIIKKLFQLTRLALGEHYDWHFKISNFAKGRQEIIREQVRDRLKKMAPKFYKLLDDIYNNQIRNATGHSQYAFVSRNIHLHNYKESKFYELQNITFDDWEIYIHSVVILYNEMIWEFQERHEVFKLEAVEKQYGLQLRVTKEDSSTELEFYKFLPDVNRWAWYKNIA